MMLPWPSFRVLTTPSLLTGAAVFLFSSLLAQGDPAGPIAQALQPFVDAHTLPGAVGLVASPDAILDIEAVGYADVAGPRPMAKDSLFWIASMSKPMTTAAFMMLVEEGKVSPDDLVSKYIPEFADIKIGSDPATAKKPEHPITIRQLLSHTSGLPFGTPQESPHRDKLSLEQRAKDYAAQGLQTEPGTKYSYSNAGINTVARIMEIVSGMPYEQFMQERLFKPLGMKDTTFWPTTEQLDRLAKSYKVDAAKTGVEEVEIDQLSYPLDDTSRTPVPAGGLFSTAEDIGKFLQMVANKGTYKGQTLLSQDSVTEMTSKQTGDAVPDGYGYGWMTAGDRLGHSGAYRTDMNINRTTGVITVFLVQQAGSWPNDGDQKILPAFDHAVSLVKP